MRKLLGLALALASIGVVGLESEAKANEVANNSVVSRIERAMAARSLRSKELQPAPVGKANARSPRR